MNSKELNEQEMRNINGGGWEKDTTTVSTGLQIGISSTDSDGNTESTDVGTGISQSVTTAHYE